MIDNRNDRHLTDTTNMLQQTTQHGTYHIATNGTAVCPAGMMERILQENRQLLEREQSISFGVGFLGIST